MMNPKLQQLLDAIQQSAHLSDDEKKVLERSVQEADKEMEIVSFKLDRTEKVKRTTAILLEETIEELEQKRKAVELQNRELEIESSLERVRTVAMGMRKPDDMLDVCRIISEQLEILKVKEIRNVQTAIIYESKGTYLNYEYYVKHDKSFITEVDFKNHEIQEKFANQMLKGAGALFTESLKGKEVQKWYAYQKTTNQFVDIYLEEASSLTYYWSSLGPVALGMSTYAPLSEAEINLFQRFRNVFELAYKRFIDIEKALAQAKEAQLEASLERVRAQAMAMRTPGDLMGICEVLYTELHTLGFTGIRNAMINIHDDEKETFVNYDYSDEIGKSINHLSYKIHPVIENQIRQMRSAGDAFSETYFKGKDLEDWKAFRKKIGEKEDTRINNTDALYYYFYSIGTGSIGISTFGVMAEEKLKVLKRFRNVFNLSYQRYTDIAQAEAQAKEARIETALERVRAVAMAMKKSEELADVCEVMYNELTDLGFSNLRNAQVAIENDERQSYFLYIFSTSEKLAGIETAYNSSPVTQQLYRELGKSGDALYEREYSESEMKAWRQWRNELAPLRDPREEKAISLCWYMYSTGKGHIGISTFNAITKEQIEIVKRFKTVFELSYKRFDDLQKAEAQTRESQIQLALERVRARTMAMQRSEELSETAWVLFQQFKELGEDPEQIGIGIINEEEAVLELWTTINGKMRDSVVKVSLDEPVVMRKSYTAWKKGDKKLVIDISGKELDKYNNYRNSLTDVKIDRVRTKDRRVINFAFFSKGGISLATSEPKPAETIQLLERFANVFDLTYTRFLDLQKAEAQAREAQIELALERVRARTMAMQHSVELQDTSLVLFQQLKELGEPAEQCTIGIIKESEGVVEISATLHGTKMHQTFRHKIDEPFVMNKIFRGWKDQERTLLLELKEEELKKYNLYRNELVGKETFPVKLLPGDRWIIHAAYFSKGMLALSTNAPRPVESLQLLERFAKVFEQTYTRFLDLQKAEAQGREAQIEAALERTRTQSMIMQHSKELDDTLRVFHQQVLLLGINSAFSFLWLPDEKNDRHIFWAAWGEDKKGATIFKSKAINYPLDRNEPATAQCLLDWKSTEPVYSYHVPPPAVGNYFAAWKELIDGVEELKPDNFSGGLYYVEAFMKYGCFGVMVTNDLTEEQKKILARFAIEFERTYTRFLDLQKAEAQMREAQIEASLEKIRSRTMAMQKSSDLGDTSALLFGQLYALVPELWTCGFVLCDRHKTTDEWWLSGGSGFMPDLILPNMGDALHNNIYQEWMNGASYYEEIITGDALKQHYDWLMTIPSARAAFDAQEAKGIKQPVWQQLSCAYFSRGYLVVITEQPCAQAPLFKRFAQVFEQTYTRFLDLQKAEAQAREAQVENALERV